MQMAELTETRRKNLEFLIEHYGSVVKLNKAAGRPKYDTTFNHIKNKTQDTKTKKARTMGEAIARRLEADLKLPPGWMDETHDEKFATEIAKTDAYLRSNLKKIKRFELPSKRNYSFFDGELELTEFFLKSINPSDVKNVRFYPAPDDSLASIAPEGSTLLLDLGINSFVREGIYLIESKGNFELKLISHDYQGGYIIRNDRVSHQVDNLDQVNIKALALYVFVGKKL